METWIKNNFNCRINEFGQEVFECPNPYGCTSEINTTTFVSIYKAIQTPPTATALKAVDINSPFNDYFEKWVELGIIQP